MECKNISKVLRFTLENKEQKSICIEGVLFMIVPRYYENLNVLHENTMPARAYYIPESASYYQGSDGKSTGETSAGMGYL